MPHRFQTLSAHVPPAYALQGSGALKLARRVDLVVLLPSQQGFDVHIEVDAVFNKVPGHLWRVNSERSL